jgi:hypothetical protein
MACSPNPGDGCVEVMGIGILMPVSIGKQCDVSAWEAVPGKLDGLSAKESVKD